MPSTFSLFAKNDYARYPFLKSASRYLRTDLDIRDLVDPSFEAVLRRAQHRIEDAIRNRVVGQATRRDEDIEIMSFPVATMLVAATESPVIKKRYALAEANKVYEDLLVENKEKILEIAKNFEWKLRVNESGDGRYEFLLNFADYLRNTAYLRDRKWILINRDLDKGNVYVTRHEVARLLKEEVQRQIDMKTKIADMPKLPQKLKEITERLENLVVQILGAAEKDELPKIVVQSAFPPCVVALYQAFTSGRHLSHIGRFTLTSFLINAGMPSETVVNLFRNVSDFDERMTRYQVEHIAGERGSRTRYVTPKCETLKTHGVCINPDQLCMKVRKPLNYYRGRLRS